MAREHAGEVTVKRNEVTVKRNNDSHPAKLRMVEDGPAPSATVTRG